jgi:phospholipase/carboxylesterase
MLLLHGSDDRTVPSAASVEAGRLLKAAGYDVTVTLFPGVGHTISAEERQEALQFLRSFFHH